MNIKTEKIVKLIIGAALAVSLVIASGAFAYYLLIISPELTRNRLDFEKEKQMTAKNLKEQELKQQCLEQKSKAIKDAPKATNPQLENYRANMSEC